MRIGYVRVSTVEQNEARQVEGLSGYDIERWFVEKASAKNTDRSQLQAMLEFARERDTVYILDFSRLARSTADLLHLTRQLQEKGIALVSHKERIDTDTPTGKLMLTMIAAINEFERENLLERQREGIAIAKMGGKYKGRRKLRWEDLPEFERLYERYLGREISKSAMARELGISRPTLNTMLAEYQSEHRGVVTGQPL